MSLPSLARLHTPTASAPLIDAGYDDLPLELRDVILKQSAFLRCKFIPGVHADTKFIDVPMQHHPNPPIVDAGLLFLRGVGRHLQGWEASPVVRNAAFQLRRAPTAREAYNVVAKRIKTIRARCKDASWKVDLMEISTDESAPTTLAADYSNWKKLTLSTTFHDVRLSEMQSIFGERQIFDVFPYADNGDAFGDATLTFRLVRDTTNPLRAVMAAPGRIAVAVWATQT